MWYNCFVSCDNERTQRPPSLGRIEFLPAKILRRDKGENSRVNRITFQEKQGHSEEPQGFREKRSNQSAIKSRNSFYRFH